MPAKIERQCIRQNSACAGPFARSGTFVCHDCSVKHDALAEVDGKQWGRPVPGCKCDDCKRTRVEIKQGTGGLLPKGREGA